MKELMTHTIVGYPTLKKSEELVDEMVKCGIKKIELQIPFSDPLADGPVISHASEIALEKGIKVKDSFELMKKLTAKYREVDFYFMTYFNIVFNYGVSKFVLDSKKAGAKGLIVPDMPLDYEEDEHYYSALQKANLSPIFVISPVTDEKRLKEISNVAKDFVYLTSTIGTTGLRKTVNPKLKSYIKLVTKYFQIPLAIGFGISSKEQIQEVHQMADIAVIGSAIIKKINEDETLKKAKEFLKTLV